VGIYRLDISLPEVLYAAEYNGEEFHTEAKDQEYDAERVAWLEDQRHWKIDPFTKLHVYDRRPSPVDQLQAGFAEARRKRTLWTPHHRD
jgi:hypothetical protein